MPSDATNDGSTNDGKRVSTMDIHHAKRKWDRNERFGRYVYWPKEEQ
jgi:hypothetical protein